MKRIILILVLAALGWYGWGKYETHLKAQRAAGAASKSPDRPRAIPAASGDQGVSFFTCDGRTSCAEMTSCEEAKFYVKNCPGMSSEATRGGTTCERQWCK